MFNIISGYMQINKNLNQKLKQAIVINTLFTIFEFTIGIFSGSLSLISDAANNLTDTMSLLISLFARKLAERKPTTKKTYGYGRATILAALLNGSILLTLSFYIFREAYYRFYTPQPVNGFLVMLIGLMGIIINGSVALSFLKYRADLNIRSAFLNMIFDAAASAGALISGLVIVITNHYIIDPIISVIIAIMLLVSGWNVLQDVIHILLEGVPNSITIAHVEGAIKDTPDILALDDLHIWAISSEHFALSCHIIIDSSKLPESTAIVKKTKERLKQDFNIIHATIEIELIKCTNSSCSIFRP
jgi:cobalt-zinc-cadmium efflux system protein